MKQIKYLVMTFAAVCLTAGLTSCEKEVEKIVEKPVEVEKIVEKEVEVEVPVPQDNNWSRYQAIVTSDVLSQKKHDKVILLVAFGSTWQQAFNAFDETKAAYKEKFPDYDVFLSYSSAICINRAAAGENAADQDQCEGYAEAFLCFRSEFHVFLLSFLCLFHRRQRSKAPAFWARTLLLVNLPNLSEKPLFFYTPSG